MFAIAFGSSNVDIIKELFTNPNFDKAKHFKGEMAARNSDFYLTRFHIKDIAPLGKGDEFDVFRVSLSSNDDSEHFDLYVYMIEDGIYAVRSLAMTGVIKDLIYHYEKISDKQRKDLDLENLKLTVAKDSELIKFGKENLHKFERIFEIYGSNFLDKNDQIERILKALHLSHIESDDNVFRIVVGGMVDNIVGFFRVEKEEDTPLMHENLYIMIKKIAPKWYLFKTT
ncbi:hypothetical protein [Campylobacter sp. RM16189]|uniref:hypothetical protein n=1 Tax=Campylobacter sp. RM16189 TaxID=1705726 RepID=UPI0014763E14|nr:hypothetical protein [Campylobacter sp. RM16189]